MGGAAGTDSEAGRPLITAPTSAGHGLTSHSGVRHDSVRHCADSLIRVLSGVQVV